LVARAPENVTGHREQDGVVVQAAARGALLPQHRLAEGCERVSGYLEAQHARALAAPWMMRRGSTYCAKLP
jgi:hypothetical protein